MKGLFKIMKAAAFLIGSAMLVMSALMVYAIYLTMLLARR